ncbi:hypothetical protein RRV45_15115 [Bacillus sp. DTU_2020_1000418_1_SI_GHA_SEK_038]|uniref:hypothetical protein n=1 Tax=Bacillus sp. DTU_2020_1000418_1_SI_GHA_SEK_038 TaxID=3077585 RepID=UPI0028E75A65|nr:hypothetical protein [Bacillus sp. DTU_2020_1000418_1_SI_GHA_SEK_038]WNS74239.1 hypothetical protein RRV45_15115 [Bacillus sp. DTU_2020_1000418_1_SI_GHA_SEK_038]
MEFENDNHIVEETTEVTETTEIETQQTETNEPPATTQEEFDVIKYNKEEVRIPVSERQSYLQKGYNYDKVQQKANDYEQHLQKVAQLTGYSSIDELVQASQQFEEQQRIQQEAQRLGMDEEAYRQYIAPVNQELTSVKQQLEEMRRESIHKQIDAELNELKKDENFSKYEKETFEMATKYNMTLTEAYEFASLRGLKEQIPSIQQQAEQKVVDQIKARQGKHVETHDENAMVNLGLSEEEITMAKNMGISPEEYAKWK